MVAMNETKTVKGYFRNSPRYGRTTVLVHKSTGERLVEVMGVANRKDCYAAYMQRR